MIQMEIDVRGWDQVEAALTSEDSKVHKALQRGIAKAAVLILKDAKKRCPVATGNLRSSGYAAWEGGGKGLNPAFSDARGTAEDLALNHVEVTAQALEAAAVGNTLVMGFSVPYAVYVHEGTMRMAGRPFLADAVTANRGEAENMVGKELRRVLDR